MKTRTYIITLFIFLGLAGAVLAAGPEPDPWWKQVEQTQGLLLKWITALSVIATALLTTIFAIWAMFNSKLKELKDRQDRQSQTAASLQAQVTQNALAISPANGSPTPVTVTNSPSQPVPTTETTKP